MRKFKKGDKVKLPKSKSTGWCLDDCRQLSFAKDKGQDYMFVAYTDIGGARVILNHESDQDNGGYYLESDLELYEEPNQVIFKKGDKVRLISLDQVSCESSNWIELESKQPKIGDIFTVQSVGQGGKNDLEPYICLDGLTYGHPTRKFELIKEKQVKKFKNKLAITGSKHLLLAFGEELKEVGYTCHEDSFPDEYTKYMQVNQYQGEGTYGFYSNASHFCEPTKLELPKDWDEALKLAKEQEVYVAEYVAEYVKCIKNYGDYTHKGRIYKVTDSRNHKSLRLHNDKLHSDEQRYVHFYVNFENYFENSTEKEYNDYVESCKPKFEKGKWYYTYSGLNNNKIFKFDRIESKDTYNRLWYSILIEGKDGRYGENDYIASNELEKNSRLATEEEIKQALIKEAKKRGFKKGVKFDCVSSSAKNCEQGSEDWQYFPKEDELSAYASQYMYSKGKWATIKPNYPEITVNGYKAEFKETHVEFGCASFNIAVFKKVLELHETMRSTATTNRNLQHIKLGAGTFSIEQVKQIVDYYKNKK